MPTPHSNLHLVSCADNSNSIGPLIDPYVKDIKAYLAVLDDWLKSQNPFISPAKSSTIVFTTFSNEAGTVVIVETVP